MKEKFWKPLPNEPMAIGERYRNDFGGPYVSGFEAVDGSHGWR
jgi:hypothetical protein